METEPSASASLTSPTAADTTKTESTDVHDPAPKTLTAVAAAMAATSGTEPSDDIESEAIDRCLEEVESVFSDTTCIWENIQKFLASDNVSRDSKMTCGRTIDTYLTKMGTDIEALKHQYIRSGPERRPLEELAHDLEEKDKLIAAFTERLDKWKAKVDEYKAATMKALIGEETL